MYVCVCVCVCMYVSTFSIIFSSEISGPIEAKFHMERPWDRRTKVCSNGPGHMTKMALCPHMVKTLKNLLWNQKANDLEVTKGFC